MPSFNPTDLWKAALHTRAKIEIVSGYLYTWFEILGRTSSVTRLVYIDGFAGPGEYTNAPIGSPVAALNQAIRVLAPAVSALRSKELLFHFIEIVRRDGRLRRFKQESSEGRV